MTRGVRRCGTSKLRLRAREARRSLQLFGGAFSLLLGLLIALAIPASVVVAQDADGATDLSTPRVVRVDAAITAVSFDYLDRALAEAEAQGAPLVVELNTPGGNVSTMSLIAERFLNAGVPVVVWVGPRGAQAASAGTFIVLAAHAAGMAPATTIGAASPVGAQGEDLPETMQSKVTEDLAAQARNLAARRGEDAEEWAESAVRDAASATSEEALELGVIDAVADSVPALMVALDGLEVEVGGREVELRAPETEEVVRLRPIPMNGAERLLSLLARPEIALLLMTIGVNAILIELSNPGGYIAGALGAVALALGFYSLGVLEANLLGLVFFGVAAAMVVLELQSGGTGLFLFLGIASFIGGAVILFADTPFGVPWVTVILLAGGTALFSVFVLGALWRAMRRPPSTGFEGMLGRTAEVRKTLGPQGKVLIDGELWDAEWVGEPAIAAGAAAAGDDAEPAEGPSTDGDGSSDAADPGAASSDATAPEVESLPDRSPPAPGEEVEVVGREGFTLKVRRPSESGD